MSTYEAGFRIIELEFEVDGERLQAERDRYLAALHQINTILMEGGTRDSIAHVTRPFFSPSAETLGGDMK